jgi:hypothetical protein
LPETPFRRADRHLGFAHSEVVLVGNLCLACLCTIAAAGAVCVHIAGVDFHADIVVARRAVYLLHLGHGEDFDSGIVLDPPEVDFQAAGWGAKLGEILIQLRHSSAQIRIFFDQKDLIPHFSGLKGRGQAGNAATNHHNASTRRGCFVVCHASPPCINVSKK